jgi:putative GTP pyrophosphokinase
MSESEHDRLDADDIEKVLAEFAGIEETLGAFCLRTKSLIEAILEDAGIRYQSIQFRVKAKKKLREKYLDPSKNYKRLDDITDLAGLRVITYYEDDVERVAKIVKEEFEVDLKNSVDKRDSEPDKFGYNAINYVCCHVGKRTSDVEYKKFSGVRCEIQITSILRHAWSEIEHEWYDLKDSYPKAVKRRFYRIAALLELAESEFLSIRMSRTEYEQSVAVRVEANVVDLPVNAVSIKSLIEHEPLVAELDAAVAASQRRELLFVVPDKLAELRSAAATHVGLTKLLDIRDGLRKYKLAIPEFARRCAAEGLLPGIRPGTVSRGVCIHYLCLLLSSIKGTESITRFFDGLGSGPRTTDLDRLYSVALSTLSGSSVNRARRPRPRPHR